jgi:putative DNA primase/helicase
MLDLNGAENELIDSTPDFFNTTALPLSYDSQATCPTWLSFLHSSIGDEPDKIQLLQEWMGYCLTPDTSRHKLMYFRGESGGGKGTVLRVMQGLVGGHQFASSSLTQLAESFGLAPLVGKLICTIGDARLSKNADAMRGLEVLLGLTGDDAMQVNRKFRDQLEGAFLTARITIASNDFLDVPDHSGAMLRRLNVIQFSKSFRDNPDPTLTERLLTELEGIAVWALQGLRRLRWQGDFTKPASSVSALLEWERDTNPMVAWMQDCCEPNPATVTLKDALYDCWLGWTKNTHRSTWTRSVFLRRLQANAGYTTETGAGIRGIAILPAASRRFLGRP